MKSKSRLRRLIEIVAVAGALGAVTVPLVREGQRRSVRSLLGPNSDVAAVNLYPRSSSGRLDSVRMAVPIAGEPTAAPIRVSVSKLWFTYDLPSMLRRQFVFPKVVLEGVELHVPSLPEAQSAFESIPAWFTELENSLADLQKPEQLEQTASLREISAVDKRWREAFEEINKRSTAIQNNTKALQQELRAQDNRLRSDTLLQDALIKLDTWNKQLDEMSLEIKHSDALLQLDRRRIREALLTDQETLATRGSSFVTPSAEQPAELLVRRCITEMWEEHRSHLLHAAAMLHRPDFVDDGKRGEEIDHTGSDAPRLAVFEAKLSGTSRTFQTSRPFTALARYHVGADRVANSEQDSVASNDIAGLARRAQYRLEVGKSDNAITIQSELRQGRDGTEMIRMELREPDACDAVLEQFDDRITGTLDVHLRSRLDRVRESLLQAIESESADGTASELYREALADNSAIPENIEVRVTGTIAEPNFEMNEKNFGWLQSRLHDSASAKMRSGYADAGEAVEQAYERRVFEINNAVAVRRNDSVQLLERIRSELLRLRADTGRELSSKSDLNVVRIPSAARSW